jgi:hypothetical protein
MLADFSWLKIETKGHLHPSQIVATAAFIARVGIFTEW